MTPEAVQTYLKATAGLPWVWGCSDCMMWAAGLVYEVTGCDPAEDLRETYDTGGDAADVVRAEGGYLKLMTHRLSGVLIRDDGADWGVGLVRHETFGRAACIVANGRAILKTDGGATPSDAALLARWRV